MLVSVLSTLNSFISCLLLAEPYVPSPNVMPFRPGSVPAFQRSSRGPKLVEGFNQLVAQGAAERINWRIVEGRDPDVIRDLRLAKCLLRGNFGVHAIRWQGL